MEGEWGAAGGLLAVRFDEAIERLEDASRARETNLSTEVRVAELFIRQGRLAGALARLRHAARLFPDAEWLARHITRLEGLVALRDE